MRRETDFGTLTDEDLLVGETFSVGPAERPGPLQFSYDEAHDILTVEGIPFSGEYFRLRAAGYTESSRPQPVAPPK